MVRFICALVLVLLLVSPSLGQQSLVGTYKLVSHGRRGGWHANRDYGEGSPWLPRDHANPRHLFTSRQIPENSAPLWLRRPHSWTRW